MVNPSAWFKANYQVQLPDLVQWAIKNNISVPDDLMNAVADYLKTMAKDFDSDVGSVVAEDEESDGINEEYSTQLLEITELAIDKFWRTSGTGRKPKKLEIIGWLESEHNLTKRQAEAIDTIIRPDEFKKGGNISIKN